MSETLLFGEIGAAGAIGAELWYLAPDSFGQQDTGGADAFLRVETANYLPAGRGGEANIRKIWVPFAYEGACKIRVTPIVDFDTALTSTIVSFATPTKRTRKVIEAKPAKRCTQIRIRIEVVSCSGRVEFFTPEYATDIVTQTSHTVTGKD